MSACATKYCLDMPTTGQTAQEIGVSDEGFHNVAGYILDVPTFSPTPSTAFRFPVGVQLRLWNNTATDHLLLFRGVQYTLVVSAQNAGPPFDIGTPGVFPLTCETHTSDGDPVKSASLTLYVPGVMDINQSEADGDHGGGCCRTSIRLTVRARYNGYGPGHYPKYLKFRTTVTYYGWTAPAATGPGGLSHETWWRGVQGIPAGTVIQPSKMFTLNRIRSPFFGREARPEIYFEGDYLDFNAYAGQYIGGRLERDLDNQGEVYNLKDYFLINSPWVDFGTYRESNLEWWYILDSDEEDIYFETIIGTIREEYLEPYLWEDFAGDVLSLLYDAAIEYGGDPFKAISYPNCELQMQWRDDRAENSSATMLTGRAGGPCVIKDGLICCQDPTENGPGNPRQSLYDDDQGEFNLTWPRPNIFPPDCMEPTVCGGFGPTGVPYDYDCITEDIGNSENGIYPLGTTSTPGTIGAFKELRFPLWEEGFSTLYRNNCASSQQRIEIRSPPIHLMSSITYDTSESGIFVTWSPVKRWYNAAFCRRVYENKTGYAAPVLVGCEHSADQFGGPNVVPADATYDSTGRYTTTLVDGVTYQFSPGSTVEFIEDDSTGTPTNRGAGHFKKRAGHALDLIGPPSTPVASTLKNNTSLAPCAILDDPATRIEIIRPPDSISLTSDWINLGWHNQIPAGAVWTRFAEIDCPSYGLASNPPCGCET